MYKLFAGIPTEIGWGFFALLLLGSTAVAQQPAPRPYPPIPVLNWEARSDWKSVKAAGAVGDGVTDDTPAIQRVLDTVGDKFTLYAGDQDTIYFPAGTYRITNTLRVGGKVLRTHGTVLIGNGRDTRLVWNGPVDKPMLASDGLTYARYEGLVFDGNNTAGVGIFHPNKGFTTECRYRHLAFLNIVDAGILVDPARAAAQSDPMFENCFFDRCGRGVVFLRWNDYHFAFDGCEFRNCGLGLDCDNGNFYVRDTHFTGSRIADIKANPEHACSIRRVTSLNSSQFLLYTGGGGPMTVQDVQVARKLPALGCAIHAAGWPPLTIFDSVFTGPPGSTPPLRIHNDTQPIILSNNTVTGFDGMMAWPRNNVYTVPAGARGGSLHSAEQTFIKDTVRIPGKVFDAKRDFGAKADGQSDDTAAIQAAIDAARTYRKGAIAYLPAGRYAIKASLKITGSDYTLGGQGWGAFLRWTGPEGGDIISVLDPHNVTLEFFQVGNDAGNNAADIRQTGTGAGSSIIYDGVRVYGYYKNTPNDPVRQGLKLVGLGPKDQVVINVLQGNIQVIDSADATILGNFTWEGSIVVEGKKTGRNGFLGFQSRLATLVDHALFVKDNQNFVASDFYNEQSRSMLSLSGSPELPAGRIVITGARSNMNSDTGTTIENYRGELFIGGKDFSDHRTPTQPTHGIYQTGTAPVDIYFFGDTFYGAKLEIKQQQHLRLFAIGNYTLPAPTFFQYTPPETNSPEVLKGLARALDELRRLGELDLQLNHPDVR